MDVLERKTDIKALEVEKLTMICNDDLKDVLESLEHSKETLESITIRGTEIGGNMKAGLHLVQLVSIFRSKNLARGFTMRKYHSRDR